MAAMPQLSNSVGYSRRCKKPCSSVHDLASFVVLYLNMLKQGTERPPVILKFRTLMWIKLIKSHITLYTSSSSWIPHIEKMSLMQCLFLSFTHTSVTVLQDDSSIWCGETSEAEE
jgi:hypothetical protein